MKVVVLGGAGYIGSCAVRELVKRAPDIEVVIAEKNVEAASKLVAEVGGKTSVKSVDANEHKSLVEAMKDAVVVLSTLGPYYVFGEKVLKAAMEAKTNFIDINDDWDATEKCLELDKEANNSKITAVIGLGATPGLTNLMARYGADQLDRVDEIHIAWGWTALDPKIKGTAILDHYFHCMTGEVDSYRNGKWVKIPANSEPEIVEFVSPIGRLEVVSCGHPEPITIPRYIKGVKNVFLKGGGWPSGETWIGEFLLKTGMIKMTEITINGMPISARSLASQLVLALPKLAPEFLDSKMNEVVEKYGEFAMEGGVLRTEVKGERRGKFTRYIYGCGAPGDFMTALPAVIGVLMFTRGQIKQKGGVFAPEGIIDTKLFFKELTKDIPVEETKVEPISL